MIYVCGGLTDSKKNTNRLYAYDTSALIWMSKPAMSVARCGHILEAIDSALYVFGGKEDVFVESIECFDTITEQWSVIENTTYAGRFGSAFVCENIFIAGGSIKVGDTSVTSSKIFEYDIKSKMIKEVQKRLQCALVGHFSKVMTLPQLL